MGQFQLNFAPEIPQRRIYKIAEISKLIREKLERDFADVWVQGEISNFRPASSGILYFTLKDDSAQLRCVCFRTQARYLKFRPEDGLEVLARGKVGVYEARGEYQLYVEFMEPQGLGALQLAFEQLKKKLAAEGLFDASRKKPLPRLPRRIGIITSPRGAVIQDIRRILKRRYENLHLLVYPVRVQGEGAADEIVEALRFFHRPPPDGMPADVLILARGGGSIEDLWAFNEERLARAIAACGIPVISAIGHETDFTIADFVADLRAPTPSAAAELVIEPKDQLKREIAGRADALKRAIDYRILQLRHDLIEIGAHRGFRTLRTLLGQAVQRMDDLHHDLAEAGRARLRAARKRWEHVHAFLLHRDLRGKQQRDGLRLNRQVAALGQQAQLLLLRRRARFDGLFVQLQSLGPRQILDRGYAIVFDANGKAIKNAGQAARGTKITVRLAKGTLGATVDTTQPE